jgi:hypothetical protein
MAGQYTSAVIAAKTAAAANICLRFMASNHVMLPGYAARMQGSFSGWFPRTQQIGIIRPRGRTASLR